MQPCSSSIAAQNYSSQYTASELEKDEADARLRMLKHLLALDEDSDIFTRTKNEITTLDWSNLNGITKELHLEFLTSQLKNGKLNQLKCLYLPYHVVLHRQCDELIEAFKGHPSIEIISWFPHCRNHPPPRMREHLAGSSWYLNEEEEEQRQNEDDGGSKKISLEHPTQRQNNLMNSNNSTTSPASSALVHQNDGRILDGGFIIDEGDNTHQSLLQEEKDAKENVFATTAPNNSNAFYAGSRNASNLSSSAIGRNNNNNSNNSHQHLYQNVKPLHTPNSALSSFSRPSGGGGQKNHQHFQQEQESHNNDDITIDEIESRWVTIGKLIQATKETPSLLCVCLPPSFVPEQQQLSNELQVQLFELDEAAKLQEEQYMERMRMMMMKRKQQQRRKASSSSSKKINNDIAADDDDEDDQDDGDDGEQQHDDDEYDNEDEDEIDIVDAFNNNSSTASYFYQQYFNYFINEEQKNGFVLSNRTSAKDLSQFQEKKRHPSNTNLTSLSSSSGTGLMHLIKLFSSYKNFTLRRPPPPVQPNQSHHQQPQSSSSFSKQQQQQHHHQNINSNNASQHHLHSATTSPTTNAFFGQYNESSNNNLTSLITPGHSISQQNVFGGVGTTTNNNADTNNHHHNPRNTKDDDNATTTAIASSAPSTIESNIFGPATEAVVRVFGRSPDVSIFRDLNGFLEAQKSRKFHRNHHQEEEEGNEEELDDDDAGAVHPIIVAAVLRGLLDYCLTINQLREPALVSRLWVILEALLADTSHHVTNSNLNNNLTKKKIIGETMPSNTLSLVFLQDDGESMSLSLLPIAASGGLVVSGEYQNNVAAENEHQASKGNSRILSFNNIINNHSSSSLRIKSDEEIHEEREYQEKLAAIERLPIFRQQDALYELTAERNKKLNLLRGNNNNNNFKSPKKEDDDDQIPTTFSGADDDENDDNNYSPSSAAAAAATSSPVPVRRYDRGTLHLALDLILMSPFGLPRMTIDFWNKLTTVDLSNQGRLFGDAGAALVAKLLRQSGGILPVERLALRSNHISDVGFDALVSAVFESENQYLREMDLRQNVIADSAARAIIPQLRVVRCVLRTMLVDDNAISPTTASLLATGLLLCGQPAAVRRTVANLEDETGDACRAVELSRCGLDDLGCKLLLQAIRKRGAFETLVSVDLSCNRITDDGASVAARIIDACQTLKTMVLCENEIGVRGAEALIASASARRSLNRLDLADQKPKPLPEHTLKRVEFAIALHGAPLATQHQVASVIRGDPSATKVSFNKVVESSFLRLSTHHIRVALAAVRDAPKGKIAIRCLEVREHQSEFPLCDISQILSDVFLTVSVRKIVILDLTGNGLDHKSVNVLTSFLSTTSSSSSSMGGANLDFLNMTASSLTNENFSNNNQNNNEDKFFANNNLDQTIKGGWCSSLRELYLDNNNFSATAADAFADLCLRRNTNLTKLSLEGNPSISQSQRFDVSLACDMNFLGTNLKQRLVDLMTIEKNLTGNFHHHNHNQQNQNTSSISSASVIMMNASGSLAMTGLPASSAAFVEIDVTPFVSTNNNNGLAHHNSSPSSSSVHHLTNGSFGSLREFASFRKQNDANAHYNNFGNPTTRFGDFGARVFANVLSLRLPRVKSIVLRKCAISDAGVEYLAKNLLQVHPALSSVDLSYNNISAVGAQHLLKALKVNPRIQQLLLDGNSCSMDPALYRELLNTLKNNRQLASCAKGTGENNNNTQNNNNNQQQQQLQQQQNDDDNTTQLQKQQQEKSNEVYQNRTLFDEDKIKPKLKVTSNNKEYDESVRDYLREERRVEDAIFLDAMQSHWRGLHGNYVRQTPKLHSLTNPAVKRSIVYQITGTNNRNNNNDSDDDVNENSDKHHHEEDTAASLAARQMENSQALSSVHDGSTNLNHHSNTAIVLSHDPSAASVLASKLIPRAEHEFSNIRTQQLQEQQAMMMIGHHQQQNNATGGGGSGAGTGGQTSATTTMSKNKQRYLMNNAAVRSHHHQNTDEQPQHQNDEEFSTPNQQQRKKNLTRNSEESSELAGSPATALLKNRRR